MQGVSGWHCTGYWYSTVCLFNGMQRASRFGRGVSHGSIETKPVKGCNHEPAQSTGLRHTEKLGFPEAGGSQAMLLTLKRRLNFHCYIYTPSRNTVVEEYNKELRSP